MSALALLWRASFVPRRAVVFNFGLPRSNVGFRRTALSGTQGCHLMPDLPDKP
jgi:hypothetical protein